MSDIRRLEDEGDAFERQLLASARSDRMSPGAREALVASVTAAASAAALGTHAATVGKGVKTGLSGIAKWLAVAAAGTALAGAVAIPMVRARHASSSAQPQANLTATAAAPASLPPAGTDTAGMAEAPATEAQAAEDPESKTPSAPTRLRSPASAHPRHRPPALNAPPNAPSNAAPADGSSLTAELALIEQARTSLGAGHPESAIRALDEHRAKFAHGALAEEAAVLRIESLARMGDGATATTLARSFLAARPRSPYASRVRRVLSTFDAPAPQ